jgi:hypothetical protein
MIRIQDQITSVSIAIIAWTFSQGAVQAAEGAPAAAPPFSAVYNLVRSNMSGVSESELNQAAVVGFLAQLQGRATLATNGTAETDLSAIPLVSKAAVFDNAYALVRIGRVGPGLSNEVAKAYDQLRATNKLKGMVVDLRYSVGQDYPAAADTAALFFKLEQPLLQWGDTTARSSAKNTAIELPLIVLINHDTTGAAEALAAALRQVDGSLIIGSPSAGHAYLYKEFTLGDGQVLRVATDSIATGHGQTLSTNGLTPDILIAVNPEDEKAYFQDPYRILPKPFAQAAKPGTNDLSSMQSTNRTRRRLNEAELVRMQRDGLDLETEAAMAGPAQPSGPVLTDPALARALDLLKGLALAAKRR